MLLSKIAKHSIWEVCMILNRSLKANQKVKPEKAVTRQSALRAILIVCAVGVYAGVSRPALSQVASSTTLVGTVTDSSGAVIPGASVVAVQDATKVAFRGQTSSTGNYTIPYVAVGAYTITVEAAGF